MTTAKRVNYRDSETGKYIPKKVADRKDPRTWEKEVVKTTSPKKR